MSEHVKHFPELRFTVVAKPDAYKADFRIYNDYEYTNDGPQPDNVLVTGYVKWDGCSNWWFGDPEYCECFHGCERKHMLDIGQVMAECWDWTKELCAHWNAEVAE
jgi:hypothetical protein